MIKAAHAAFVLTVLLALLLPRAAAAQECETPIAPMLATAGAIAGNAAALTGMQTGLTALIETNSKTMLNTLVRRIDQMEDRLLATRMKKFADDWMQAWRDMTVTQVLTNINQVQQLATAMDNENIVSNKRALEQQAAEMRKDYEPTVDACRFETAARAMHYTVRAGKKVSAQISTDFNKLAANGTDTPAGRGQAAAEGARYQEYREKFCDPDANGGKNNCAGTPDPMFRNASVLPSRTLFGRYTIDMKHKMTQDAVMNLAYNISGYRAPDPIPAEALRTPAGIAQAQTDRERRTQMDAVGALINGIIAERTLGTEALDIQQRRHKPRQNGAALPLCSGPGFTDCASATPSEREIRQAQVEDMWDPAYYIDLQREENGVTRKEVLANASNLMMLYKLLEKMEKISNIYAVETANMLFKTDTGTGSGVKLLNR